MAVACTFAPPVYDAILPRPEVRTVDWAQATLAAPPPIKGNINFDLFPYMVEPLDCIDDPYYTRVTIQAAARTGKTVGAQCAKLRIARHNPHDMLWAEPDEHSCRRVLRRSWKMAESCRDLAGRVPPRRLQSSTHMQFVDCLVHGAWSGSVSTSADLASYLTVKNEVDKMSRRKKRGDDGEDVGEADFYDLLDERSIGFPGATIVEISTPAVKGSSRIEASRLVGDNRQYFVPCPFCHHFQTLHSGDGRQPGGLRWEKNKEGRSEPDLARETAWYECEDCRKKIPSDARYEMINAGKYVKEGQKINRRGRISGKPQRPGPHASFGPLGRHYSLLPGINWGSIAYEYVKAKRDPTGKKWRHYLNSVDGRTWDPKPKRVEPHELAARLRGDTVRGICPEWTAFVTIAADVGEIGDTLFFYWMAVAWGPVESFKRHIALKRGQAIDWGIAEGKTAWLNLLADRKFEHADGGGPLRWAMGGVDSGYQGKGTEDNQIYDLCEGIRNLHPLKGSSASLGGDWYRWGFKHADATKAELQRKKRANVGDLLHVSTPLSQSWRQNVVTGRVTANDESWISLPVDVCDDHEAYAGFFNELMADRLVDGRWNAFGQANEYGDVLRYNKVLAELHTEGKWESLVRAGTEKKTTRESYFAKTKKRRAS